MTDDLVRDLRGMGYITCAKAADEINRLRAVLREIASQCHNLPRGATADRIDQIARRVLENKP